MSDDSRALLANLENLGDGRALLVDLWAPDLLETLPDHQLTATDLGPSPEVLPAPWAAEGEFTRALIKAPKSRRRLDFLVSLARDRVQDDGLVVVVSPKRGAGGSIRVLAEHGDTTTLAPKAHRKVVSIEAGRAKPFQLKEWRTTEVVDTPLGEMSLVWYPGVFAEGRLDSGTQMLLQNLPDSAGAGLDIGTGCGVLTVGLARICSSVQGIESDHFAALATNETLAANSIPLTIEAAREPNLEEASFDLVISNPPFHEGLNTTTATSERLLAKGARLLSPEGELRIVANRFLPYERVLRSSFQDSEVIAEDGHFRVWKARRAL